MSSVLNIQYSDRCGSVIFEHLPGSTKHDLITWAGVFVCVSEAMKRFRSFHLDSRVNMPYSGSRIKTWRPKVTFEAIPSIPSTVLLYGTWTSSQIEASLIIIDCFPYIIAQESGEVLVVSRKGSWMPHLRPQAASSKISVTSIDIRCSCIALRSCLLTPYTKIVLAESLPRSEYYT